MQTVVTLLCGMQRPIRRPWSAHSADLSVNSSSEAGVSKYLLLSLFLFPRLV